MRLRGLELREVDGERDIVRVVRERDRGEDGCLARFLRVLEHDDGFGEFEFLRHPLDGDLLGLAVVDEADAVKGAVDAERVVPCRELHWAELYHFVSPFDIPPMLRGGRLRGGFP